MSDDLISRANTALENIADWERRHGKGINLLPIITDLAAEVRRLQAGGPWVEHVERQRAMKRERDGECICNTGPDTDGPDEFCPWHGRRYSELADIIVRQQAEINRLT